MVWSHYRNEINSTIVDNGDDDGDDDVFSGRYLEYDDWCLWYHTELSHMYGMFRGYIDDSYLTNSLYESGQFADFCWFVFTQSSGYAAPYRW